MMSKASNFDIIIHVQAQASGKTLRSVFLAIVSKLSRQFTQISIKQAIDQLVVFRTTILVLDRYIGNCLEILVQFTVIVLV